MIYCALLGILLLHQRVAGYSQTCQEAIAMTAMSKISGGPLGHLKRLLHNKDAVDVSHWADKVAKAYTSTAPYLSWDFAGGTKSTESECVIPGREQILRSNSTTNLLSMLKHFYSRLHGASDNPIVVEYPDDMAFTDADSLRFVIGLMTHLHNPMAYQHRSDHGIGDESPKDVIGSMYIGSYGDGQWDQVSLYQALDEKICDQWKDTHTQIWNSGWTHYQALGTNFYQTTVHEFGSTLEENLAAFDNWAIETARMKCQIMEMHNMRSGFELSHKELERFWGVFYRRNILKAGVRLSVVLQKILDKQDAVRLRKGSGVEVLDIKISGNAAVHKSVGKVVFINTSIVSVVVFLGWWFLVREGRTTSINKGSVNQKSAKD